VWREKSGEREERRGRGNGKAKQKCAHASLAVECAILHLWGFGVCFFTRHMEKHENPFEISQRAKAFIQLEGRQ